MRQLRSCGNVSIIPPCSYRESLALIASARRVLTDSGGVQREAYCLKVPSLIIRDVTEWVEILKAGGGKLVGFSTSKWAKGLGSMRFSFQNRTICRAGAASRIAQLLAGFA
jgi:UDP-N-acetylglucosamine 2-epimerase